MTRARLDSATLVALDGLPGAGLRGVLALLVSPESLAGVIDPILADLHAEWAEAPGRLGRSLRYARMLGQLAAATGLLMTFAGLGLARRRLIPCTLASAITLGLLLLMHTLIAPQPPPPPGPAYEAPLIVAVREPATRSVRQRRPPPERSKKVPGSGVERRFSQRPEPPLDPSIDGPDTWIGFEIEPPDSMDFGPSAVCAPLVRVEPEYPIRAIQRGIEGSVVVAIEIAPSGAVIASDVVESAHPLLDAAALRAAARWRYRPVERGEGAACTREQVMLTFELPED